MILFAPVPDTVEALTNMMPHLSIITTMYHCTTLQALAKFSFEVVAFIVVSCVTLTPSSSLPSISMLHAEVEDLGAATLKSCAPEQETRKSLHKIIKACKY